MRTTVRLLLNISLLLASRASAQEALSLDEIVRRHVEALGGAERIHALQSLVIRGMHHEGGAIPSDMPVRARNYMAFLRPYYQVIGDPAIPNPDLREGFDGSAWEYYGDPGIVVRTVGAAAAATRHTSEFLQDSLLDYRDKGTRLELAGVEKIGDRECYKIKATLADEFQKFVFVDRHTFLVIADRKSAPIHAFGNSVTSETRFSEFQPVNGVLLSRRELEVEIATGRVLAESRRVSIEANTLHDPAIFSPAPRTRTPLQECLEQLYNERTDTISVMYTYRLFRRTHPELDTRAGIEFVGYQMVKMGDYAAALELLKANAADYPNAASSQFGLGRAYVAAGNAEMAKEAFAQALKIDPKFTKATDGLNALR